ncbi:MAG: ABC transporter substrate-binding protein [Ilumatobacteraceae bacterium]
MKSPIRGVRRKVAAAIAVALVASLGSVAPSSAAKVSAPVRGGELKVGVFDQFIGFCMADNNANSALFAVRSMYETWVEQRADGKIVPYLLRNMTPSADFKTWTLTVRDGITFHDGSPVNAQALVLNLEALRGTLFINGLLGRTPATPSPSTAGAFTGNIASVTATGPMTVVVTLVKAATDFPENLYGSGRFVARGAAQLTGGKCSTTVVGTGPFKLTSFNANQLVVEKNPTYWRKDASGQALPYLDKITFTYLVDAKPRESGVKNGSLDMAMFSSAGESRVMGALQKNSKVTSLISQPDYYPFIWFNNRIAPFNDRNARLAFSHALDHARYVKVRQAGLAGAVVPDSIVGPNSIMYTNKGFAKFNLNGAKDYVAKWKAANPGKELEFSFPYTAGSTDSLANVTLIKQMVEAAGMKMNLLPQTTAEIITKALPQTYQVMSLTLAEGTGTAFTLPFLVSDNTFGNAANPFNAAARATGNLALAAVPRILNLANINDPGLETLLVDARATNSPAAKRRLYQQATQRVQSEAYVATVGYTQYGLVYSKKVQGVNQLGLTSGGKRRQVTNFGIDLTAVYKTR